MTSTEPPGWKAMVFQTTTGQIVNNDLPIVGVPTFNRQINQVGSVQVKVLMGDTSVPDKVTLRSYLAAYRYSLALVYGTYIAQAGPIMTAAYDDTNDQVTITAGGLWALLNHRMLVSPSATLSPTSVGTYINVASTQDTTYSSLALHDVAAHLVSDSKSRTYGSVPVDVPSDLGGTNTRSYPIYDLVTVGQRLQELTQVDQGPDVDFAPYFDLSNPGYIRWNMRVGNPMLSATVTPLYWDYGSSIRYLSTDSNGQNLSTAVFVKGNTTERNSQIAYAQNTTLASNGWPLTEFVDGSHTSVTDPTTLQGYATSDVSLYGSSVETWTTAVRLDQTPVFGTYDPGVFGFFNMQGHRFVPDGQYQQRVLGFQQGQYLQEVVLILQATQGAL